MIKNEFLKRILSSIILLLLFYLVMSQSLIIISLFLIFCLSAVLYEWHNMSKKKKYYYIGIIFIIFSFYSAYKLLSFDSNYEYFLLVLIICISTDIGGYIFGKFFKGPKLTSISPNKTYSGALGGFIFSLTSIFFLDSSYYFSNIPEVFNNIILITILISTVSQVGDIAISYFKRLSNVKDTGKIIPGHGGLLDRIDGMLFAFPFLYILISSNLLKTLYL